MPNLSHSIILQALDQAPRADLIAAYQRRIVTGQGKPKKLRPCKYCGESFGARDLRNHLPQCPKR